jgi:predicted Zn-dependent peptidase
MNYQKNTIKEGINLHTIKTNKFKTNLIAVFLTLPLQRKNITEEALTSAVLRRGSNNYKTTDEISIALEEMYGASFDCGIEKMGDNHVLKFYIETINEEFLPQKEEILKKQIDMIFDIVFNPFVENGTFKEEYVKMEKENLKQIIEGKKDNKARYALDRCIEEMYKNAPYGLYKYGYVEDLEKIDAKQLYEAYINITKTAKIDIFVSGKIENEEIKNIVSKNEKIIKLQERKAEFIKNNTSENVEKPKEIIEKMDITQGKLIYGITVNCNSLQDQYSAIVYNAILGGGANSKLFQNVREKASLAYTAGSSYLRQKNNIFIRLRNRNKKL